MKSMLGSVVKYRLQYVFFIAFITITLSSCRVTFIPAYDASILKQAEEIQMQIDKFYLVMLETTKNDTIDRAYSKYAEQYIDVEVKLNYLLEKNKVKPLNEDCVKICDIALNTWRKYKAEHKEDNRVSDKLIQFNKKFMDDLFYAMTSAEKAKEIIGSK